MKNVVIKDNTAYVDAFAMDVYLPAAYGDKAYRGLNYYEVAGTEVRYFGVGNMRFFDSEKEMTNPESKKVYTLGSSCSRRLIASPRIISAILNSTS